MPIDDQIKRHYPDDWPEIREAILKRATVDADGKMWLDESKPCCEQCGRPNRETVPVYAGGVWGKQYETPEGDVCATRWGSDGEIYQEWMVDYEPEPPLGEYTLTETVLTIAHLCQDPRCSDPDHLRALCQRCHLAYDNRPDQRKKRETIYRELRGQLSLTAPAGCEAVIR